MLRTARGRLVLLAGAFALFCRFLWLKDASLLGDEAALLRIAFDSNLAGSWPDHGLEGTRGAVYGPMAIWIYKGFLWLSHDLLVLTILKVLWDTVLLGAGMLLLWQAGIRYSPEWWLVPVLSPYLWFYSRQLWDNNFLIGFSVIALGSALCFLRERRFWYLALCTASLGAAINTHLMAVSLVAGIGIAIGIECRGWLLRNPIKAVAALLPFLLCLPYALFLRTHSPGDASPLALSSLDGSLLGAKLQGAFLFPEYFLGAGKILPRLWVIPAYPGWILSALLILVSWNGIWRFVRKPDSSLRLVVLCVLAAQVALSFYKNVVHHPHYLNAIWPVFWIFSGEGWDWRRQGRWFAVASVVALVNFQVLIHANSGMQSVHYGPSIGEWLRVHRESPSRICLNQFSNLEWAPAMVGVFDLLEKLEPHPAGSVASCSGRIELEGPPPNAALVWRSP